jgi:glutamyl-Q tRNA(Asp) synthetase
VPAYAGRFAPSPTGALHAGSLVAALASWLDARAHSGRWLLRIEDLDTPRCVPGADQTIVAQLAACGLVPDEVPLWQSQRTAVYARALDALRAADLAYPCGCSRSAIDAANAARGIARPRNGERVYPGTCRSGLHGSGPGAWRMRTQHAPPLLHWHDRRLGAHSQNLHTQVGDFVLRRADGLFTYQLAVVVDDAEQGISHVVRGEDLADNTARQRWLQDALGLPAPQYLHTPLVRGRNGEKLSKQNGAQPIDTRHPLAALNAAAAMLDLPAQHGLVGDALAAWVNAWPWKPAPPTAVRSSLPT